MASTHSDIDDIRRHMAQIRRELHEDVQGVVRGAEAATDWKRYLRKYPWVTIGAAFAVGYLVVPRRKATASPAIPYVSAETSKPLVSEATRPAEPEKKKGKPLWKSALGLATPFLLRSAQGYALQYFEQFLAQKMAQQQSPFADLAASFLQQNGGATPGPQNGAQAPASAHYPS